MNTPVIFIIFNRPNTTKIVFESIRNAHPKKLFVIADGPRKNIPSDKEKCKQARDIIDGVDWDCELVKDYSNLNLGCRSRVSSGLTNAFLHFEQAIILEDDCVPHPDFFKFCEEILEKYKNNKRILTVSGNNFLFERSDIIKDDYYFSKYPHIWGWATWKRAWKLYDDEMRPWPEIKKKKIFNKNLSEKFDAVYKKELNSWATNWTFTSLLNNGLTVIPRVNLVSNIGFGKNATHTKIKTRTANMRSEEISFPIKHPNIIAPNYTADKISDFQFTRLGIAWGIFKSLIKK